MTLGTDVGELHQKPLRRTQDPSQSLSQRDALVLYLAHLNYLAEKSLINNGLSADVMRRYAHPAWDDAAVDTNSNAMKRIMAESIVLAKCFADEFEKCMPLSTAKCITRMARTAEDNDLPFELLLSPVYEATAAGAGALMATRESRRQPYVILDIGAGTTDVAGCICVNNPEQEFVKVTEVTSARKAIRRAGNIIDSILQNEIMKRSSLTDESTEHDRVSKALRKSIRTTKENLFINDFVIVELASGETVEIMLEEFLEIELMKNLFDEIKEIVTNAAFAVVGDDSPVCLVATGGGASLPIVQDLVSHPIEKNGDRLRLRLRDAMPDDLRDTYPGLADFFPQLAVAIGGVHPELPLQIKSISEGIQNPGPTILSPVYRS